MLSLVGSSGQLLRVMDMEYSMPILGACGTCRYAGGDLGVGRSGPYISGAELWEGLKRDGR